MALPRIGDEVVVSYLDGDPDEPLGSGMVAMQGGAIMVSMVSPRRPRLEKRSSKDLLRRFAAHFALLHDAARPRMVPFRLP